MKGQCGGYRYLASRKSKKLRSIKKSAKRGGSRHRVKKTMRKH
jgi:hypothetical protein